MRAIPHATIRNAAAHHASTEHGSNGHHRPRTRFLVRAALIASIAATIVLIAASVALAANQNPERADEPPHSAQDTTADDGGLTDHEHVRFRLEGCRNPVDDPLYAPDADVLVCDDGSYTPGNLGKQWNELDLVPYRLTTHLGRQERASTTYSIAIAADHLLDQRDAEGYDHITVPTVNTDLSDPGCAIDAGPLEKAERVVGGIDVTMYRIVTITQERGSTCVFDWQQRLAGPLQASRYPGSSLHSQLLDHDLHQIGQRRVPIPVAEIDAAELHQDLEALAALAVPWTVSKEADPAALHFAEACPPVDGDLTADVDVTVTWTRADEVTEAITVRTEVRATNPSHRALEVRVSAEMTGEDAAGDEVVIVTTTTQDPEWVVVPAGAVDFTVLSHEVTTDPDELGIDPTRGFAASATATLRDPIIGDVLGDLEASATAQAVPVDDQPRHTTVTISDDEWIEGEGLGFSLEAVELEVPDGAFGSVSFADGYELGEIVGAEEQVSWTLTDVSESGSVTFTKRVHLERGTALDPDDAALHDLARVLGDDGEELARAALAVRITADVTGVLTVHKSVPAGALGPGEAATFVFDVVGPDGFEEAVTVTIEGDDRTDGTYTGSVELTDLALGEYTVTERPTDGWVTIGDAETAVSLDAPTCAATAAFANQPEVDVVVAQPGIDLVKLPDVAVAEVGDTITYTFIITNTGGMTLHDITLIDDVLGPIALPRTSLEPGESMTVTATHVVTEADLEAGQVANVAVVEAVDDEDRRVRDEDDALVTVVEEMVLPVELVEEEVEVDELPVTGTGIWRLLFVALLAITLGTAVLIRVAPHRGRAPPNLVR